MTDEQPDPRIKPGRRVICRKQGPHDGARGVVQTVLAGGDVALVSFEDSQVADRVEYFEPVIKQ